MLALLKLYTQDLKLIKSSILTSPCVPQLSHLEWLSILTGVMVNLDHVLSGMHTISNDNWEVELIGGIKLKYRATEAAKKVKNSGDWSQAFQVYTKAVTFRLPLYLWLSSRATTLSYSTMIKPFKPMLGMFGTSSLLTIWVWGSPPLLVPPTWTGIPGHKHWAHT